MYSKYFKCIIVQISGMKVSSIFILLYIYAQSRSSELVWSEVIFSLMKKICITFLIEEEANLFVYFSFK